MFQPRGLAGGCGTSPTYPLACIGSLTSTFQAVIIHTSVEDDTHKKIKHAAPTTDMPLDRPAILRLVILPRLASTQVRVFATSTTRARPPVAETTSGTPSTWEPTVWPGRLSARPELGEPSSSRQRLSGIDDRLVGPDSVAGHRSRKPGLGFGLDDGIGVEEGEGSEQKLSGQAKTTLLALQRIISALQPSPARTDAPPPSPPVRPDTSPPKAQASSSTTTSLSSAPSPAVTPEPLDALSTHHQLHADFDIVQTATTSETAVLESSHPFPIPPTVYRLLHARLHKLAVSHILSHPSYALSRPLISLVAAQLEKQGAGKLARSLRSSVESLETPPLATTSRLPPNHWHYHPIPTPPARTFPKRSSSSSTVIPDPRLTAYWNTHLSSSLRQPVSAAGQPGGAPAGPRKAPRPSPGLHQLRDLLDKIRKLEKHNGFVPDAVTANIILGCWLRCIAGGESGRAQGRSPHRGWGWRLVRTAEGWQVGWKVRSKSVIGEAELRGMFGIVANVMDTAVATHSTTRPTVEYEKHVRPFCQMMVRAMRQQGDHEGVDRVLAWKVGIKARLEKVTLQRGDEHTQRSIEAESL